MTKPRKKKRPLRETEYRVLAATGTVLERAREIAARLDNTTAEEATYGRSSEVAWSLSRLHSHGLIERDYAQGYSGCVYAINEAGIAVLGELAIFVRLAAQVA